MPSLPQPLASQTPWPLYQQERYQRGQLQEKNHAYWIQQDEGQSRPEAHLSTGDHYNQSQARSDPVVSLTKGSVHHRTDCAMGGCSW